MMSFMFYDAFYNKMFLHFAVCIFGHQAMEEASCSSQSGDKKSERMDRLRALHLRRVCVSNACCSL